MVVRSWISGGLSGCERKCGNRKCPEATFFLWRMWLRAWSGWCTKKSGYCHNCTPGLSLYQHNPYCLSALATLKIHSNVTQTRNPHNTNSTQPPDPYEEVSLKVFSLVVVSLSKVLQIQIACRPSEVTMRLPRNQEKLSGPSSSLDELSPRFALNLPLISTQKDE